MDGLGESHLLVSDIVDVAVRADERVSEDPGWLESGRLSHVEEGQSALKNSFFKDFIDSYKFFYGFLWRSTKSWDESLSRSKTKFAMQSILQDFIYF